MRKRGGAVSILWRADNGATTRRRRSDVVATTGRLRSDIAKCVARHTESYGADDGSTSRRRRSDVVPTTGRLRNDIAKGFARRSELPWSATVGGGGGGSERQMSHVRVLTRYIPEAVVNNNNSCAASHEQFTANERSRGHAIRHSWKSMLPTVINRTNIDLPDAAQDKNVTTPQYCSCS